MQFHELILFDLFDFSSFFAWTFFYFSGPLYIYLSDWTSKSDVYLVNLGIKSGTESSEGI